MFPSRLDRALTVTAVALAAVCLAGAAVAGWAEYVTPADARPAPLAWAPWSSTVPGVALAVAGAVLAIRLPRHAMTWILTAGGLVSCLNGVAAAYAVWSLHRYGGALPLTGSALYAGARLGPFLNLVAPLVLLFFPDGRLPTRRWRWAAALSLGGTALAVLVFLAAPWRILDDTEPWPQVDLPLPQLPDALWRGLLTAMPALLTAGLVVAVAAFVARFRGSDQVRRAQLRWMLLAGLLNVLLLLVPAIVDAVTPDAAFVAANVALAAAVLVAVGRYRLYDVDPLLGWTLLYGGLAAIVVAVDMSIFVGLSTLLDEPVSAVLAAGVVAVLYAPLRARIQRWVNVIMTGRGEPYDVVSALAKRLEESVGPEELLLEVASAVSAAFRSPYVRVELDRADGRTVVAEHGSPLPGVVVLPFAYRGAPIGRLALVPRAGARLAEPDQRLLADVVRQAAAAVHATALTEELQQSRERLVTGIEEERRRLRRDLHDGLGPTLAAAALKVEAAGNLVSRDTGSALDTLEQVRGDLSTVLGEVRRLVHDLRPPALDQFGLAGALRQAAGRFSDGALAITVTVTGDLGMLPAAVEVAAYRIASEAVLNVVRHAGAGRCDLRLSLGVDALEVEVADDGAGVPSGALVGVGVLGMRERAEELGGHCSVSSRAAGGTRVHAVLPLRATNAEPALTAQKGRP
ncbi:sensor histidine kinase [Acrocarpospora catenulata]|uniref:sensor histidine kinase n=1 Tax=Acrocarpospora catenulata TaxID=2836182 RepID=UPI001BDA71B7|nr:histidine kinase [Acrocarpospora catenulata]